MHTEDKDLTAHAKELVAERRYQEAVRACRRSLLVRPDDIETKVLLGMALVALRRYDELRAEMLGLVRAAPDHAAVHRMLGEAFLRTGDPHKAQEHLNRARELEPDDTAVIELLTEAQQEAPPATGTVERWLVAGASAGSGRARRSTGGNGTNSENAEAREADDEDEADIEEPVSREREALRDDESGELEEAAADGEQEGAYDESSDMQDEPSDTFDEHADARAGDEDGVSADDGSLSAEPPKRGGRDPDRRTAELGLNDLVRARLGDGAGDEMEGLPDDPLASEPTRAPSSAEAYRERVLAMRDDFTGEEATATGAVDASVEVNVDEIAAAKSALLDAAAGVPRPRDDDSGEIDETTIARSLDGTEMPEEPTLARISNAADPGDNLTIERQLPESTIPSGGRDGQPDTAEHALGGAPAPHASRMIAAPMPSAGAMRPVAHAAPGKFANVPQTTEVIGRAARARSFVSATRTRAEAWIKSGKRPRKVLVAIAAVLVLFLFLLVLASMFRSTDHLAGLRAAAQIACDDGLERSLVEAITAATPGERESATRIAREDPGRIALLARLEATGVIEHRLDTARHAREMLSLLQGPNSNLPDARIAAAYLALSEGDIPAATAAIAGMQTPAPDAEALRARGLVALAAGQLTQALDAAGAALALRPQAPRHAALYAVIAAQKGDVQDALRALASVPGGEQAPAVRVARARVLQESARDPASAASEASAVLNDLVDRATRTQQMWAHLVLAKLHADAGEDSRALQELGAAQEQWPLGDLLFDLTFVETLLDVGAVPQAREVMRQLEDKPLPPTRKARVDAELALASGNVADAEDAITAMGSSNLANFLSARAYEAKGDIERAKTLYGELLDDPTLAMRSKIRLSSLELGAGNPRGAIEILQPLIDGAPLKPRLVYLYVRALLAAGDTARAEQTVRAALEQQRDAPELLRASADVAMTLGRNTEALAMMSAAVQQRPRDPDMQAAFGEAAKRAGEVAQARNAFSRALELNAAQQSALVSLVQMHVEGGDADGARRVIDRAEQAGAPELVLSAARAGLTAVEGGGEAAIASLRELATPSAGANAWTSLGWAYVQAERDREGADAFKTALRSDANSVDARLGLALIETRIGNLERAEEQISQAERAARATTMTPEINARVAASRGRIKFELGDFDAAERAARTAIQADSRNADAHLLLANIAIERGQDPKRHLQSAIAGRAPLPEAIGRLAVLLERGDEACRLAARYLQAAPRGYDARDVRKVAAECPQPAAPPR